MNHLIHFISLSNQQPVFRFHLKLGSRLLHPISVHHYPKAGSPLPFVPIHSSYVNRNPTKAQQPTTIGSVSTLTLSISLFPYASAHSFFSDSFPSHHHFIHIQFCLLVHTQSRIRRKPNVHVCISVCYLYRRRQWSTMAKSQFAIDVGNWSLYKDQHLPSDTLFFLSSSPISLRHQHEACEAGHLVHLQLEHIFLRFSSSIALSVSPITKTQFIVNHTSLWSQRLFNKVKPHSAIIWFIEVGLLMKPSLSWTFVDLGSMIQHSHHQSHPLISYIPTWITNTFSRYYLVIEDLSSIRHENHRQAKNNSNGQEQLSVSQHIS